MTDPPQDPGPPDSALSEGEFVEALEQRLGQWRARPLFLSPEDLDRAVRWHRTGAPLGLVLDAIDEVFRNAAARRPRRQPRSLGYCEPAIEEAVAAWRDGRVGGRRPRASTDPHDPENRALLLQAAAAVRASRAPEPARSLAADRLAALGAAQAGATPPTADTLPAVERALLEACLASLEPSERAAFESELDAAAARHAGALHADLLARARLKLGERRLRRRFELPDLSLLPLLGLPPRD